MEAVAAFYSDGTRVWKKSHFVTLGHFIDQRKLDHIVVKLVLVFPYVIGHTFFTYSNSMVLDRTRITIDET